MSQIWVPIENPNNLDKIYDSISYEKSNSILRMLCDYVGMPTFQLALRQYLKRHQYKNAETLDLWNALQNVSGINIGNLMYTWTKRVGYPLVSVVQRFEGGHRIIKLHQHRFTLDGQSDDEKLFWQIPINICTELCPNESRIQLMLSDREQEFLLTGVQSDEWIKINQGNLGFYRVQYSEKILESLLPAFQEKTMNALDRFGIASDLFALAESGRTSVIDFLNFVKVCANEDNPIVWEALDYGLDRISKILLHYKDGSTLRRFYRFVHSILLPIVQKIGWEDDDPTSNNDSQIPFLRTIVINRLAKSENQDIISTALQKFYAHVDSKVDLDKELRPIIYQIAGRHLGRDGNTQLWNILQTCGLTEIERDCLKAISQTNDKVLLKETFTTAILDKRVRSQDYYFLTFGTRETKAGQEFVWKWFKKHFREIIEIFGSLNSQPIHYWLNEMMEGHCDELTLEEFEEYFTWNFKQDDLQILDRHIRQAAERIRVRIRLLHQNGDLIEEWLRNNGF